MAQRRKVLPKPVPMPEPVEHSIACRCGECLTYEAIAFVEQKRQSRASRVIGADFNPHHPTWWAEGR
jgi:hypothetical protein